MSSSLPQVFLSCEVFKGMMCVPSVEKIDIQFYPAENFHYDTENDQYICPQGHHLPLMSRRRSEEKVLAAGKILGTIAGTWEQAEKLYEKGYQMIMLMADGTSLAKLAALNVSHFKENFPKR